MYDNTTENNFENMESRKAEAKNELREQIAQDLMDAMADAPPFNPNGFHDADVMETTFDESPADTEPMIIDAVAAEAADQVVDQAMGAPIDNSLGIPPTDVAPMPTSTIPDNFMQMQAQAIDAARQAPPEAAQNSLIDIITGNTSDASAADSDGAGSLLAIGHQNSVEVTEVTDQATDESTVTNMLDQAIAAGEDIMTATERQAAEATDTASRLDDYEMKQQEDGHLEKKVKLEDDESEAGYITAAAFEDWKNEAIQYFTKFPYCEHFTLIDPNTNEAVVDFTPQNINIITYQSAQHEHQELGITENAPETSIFDAKMGPGIYANRNEGISDLNDDSRDVGRIKKLNVQAPDNIVLAEIARSQEQTADIGATNIEDAYVSLRNKGFSNREIATAANAASLAVSGFEKSGGNVGEGIAGTSNREENIEVVENAALSAAVQSVEAAAELAMGDAEKSEQLANSAVETANGARQGAESMQMSSIGNNDINLGVSDHETKQVEQLARGTEQYAGNIATAAAETASADQPPENQYEATNEQEEDDEDNEVTVRVNQGAQANTNNENNQLVA